MNGCVIPHTPIAVDFWKIRECPHCRVFFLTHLHGDHITGLTSSWNYPIYCSDISKKLLVQKHGVSENLIHELQIGQAEIVYLDEAQKEQMTVTALDANHCPGAVMFLMQGYFGTILHTGDFRFQSQMLTDAGLEKYAGTIDILYLDNTYCSPRCLFPPRQETVSAIINIIDSHPSHDILIAMRNLGKETLLCEIAFHFSEWIYVPERFFKTLEILEAPNVFSCNDYSLRIRVVPFHKVSKKFVEKVNDERPTIVIMPTALYVGIEAKPYENVKNVFIVPYSDHSSYSELKMFVSFLRPRQIVPIVKGTARGPFGRSVADRADMSVFAQFTGQNWKQHLDIPMSVQAFMDKQSARPFLNNRTGVKRKFSFQKRQSKKVKRGVTYDSPVDKGKLKPDGMASLCIPSNRKSLFGQSKERDKHNRAEDSDNNLHQVHLVSSSDEAGVDQFRQECSTENRVDTAVTSRRQVGCLVSVATDDAGHGASKTRNDAVACVSVSEDIPPSQGFEILSESSGFEHLEQKPPDHNEITQIGEQIYTADSFDELLSENNCSPDDKFDNITGEKSYHVPAKKTRVLAGNRNKTNNAEKKINNNQKDFGNLDKSKDIEKWLNDSGEYMCTDVQYSRTRDQDNNAKGKSIIAADESCKNDVEVVECSSLSGSEKSLSLLKAVPDIGTFLKKTERRKRSEGLKEVTVEMANTNHNESDEGNDTHDITDALSEGKVGQHRKYTEHSDEKTDGEKSQSRSSKRVRNGMSMAKSDYNSCDGENMDESCCTAEEEDDIEYLATKIRQTLSSQKLETDDEPVVVTSSQDDSMHTAQSPDINTEISDHVESGVGKNENSNANQCVIDLVTSPGSENRVNVPGDKKKDDINKLTQSQYSSPESFQTAFEGFLKGFESSRFVDAEVNGKASKPSSLQDSGVIDDKMEDMVSEIDGSVKSRERTNSVDHDNADSDEFAVASRTRYARTRASNVGTAASCKITREETAVSERNRNNDTAARDKYRNEGASTQNKNTNEKSKKNVSKSKCTKNKHTETATSNKNKNEEIVTSHKETATSNKNKNEIVTSHKETATSNKNKNKEIVTSHKETATGNKNKSEEIPTGNKTSNGETAASKLKRNESATSNRNVHNVEEAICISDESEHEGLYERRCIPCELEAFRKVFKCMNVSSQCSSKGILVPKHLVVRGSLR